MITGAHAVIYSTNPEADRAFLRDTLKLTHVDVGRGWLIFGLPPAEVAVHPSDKNDVHEFLLMCADVQAFVAEMQWALLLLQNLCSIATNHYTGRGARPTFQVTSEKPR